MNYTVKNEETAQELFERGIRCSQTLLQQENQAMDLYVELYNQLGEDKQVLLDAVVNGLFKTMQVTANEYFTGGFMAAKGHLGHLKS
ncbi:hypothetical protein [Priestia koreensis]|uniref:hypothetical protein n=1 Tax=Priestia koreensis TaxID=284581 RepID=UPI00301AE27A